MNRTVWKFALEAEKVQNVMLPDGAEILSVQAQGNDLYLWAMVNPEAPKQRREIVIFGTGHVAPEGELRHISTAQMHGGDLVWHIFERP